MGAIATERIRWIPLGGAAKRSGGDGDERCRGAAAASANNPPASCDQIYRSPHHLIPIPSVIPAFEKRQFGGPGTGGGGASEPRSFRISAGTTGAGRPGERTLDNSIKNRRTPPRRFRTRSTGDLASMESNDDVLQGGRSKIICKHQSKFNHDGNYVFLRSVYTNELFLPADVLIFGAFSFVCK